MRYQRHYTPTKVEEEEVNREKEEDEVLTRDGATIEEKDVLRMFGVTGALLHRILQPTAGTRSHPLPNVHEKIQRMAATIAEKKDIFDLIVLQGRKEMPYATEGIPSRDEKTTRRRKTVTRNDSQGLLPSARK